MTDNEIIKSYELCFAEKGTSYTCAVCPYYQFGELCKVNRDKDALDLINRQNAEIEALQMDNAQLQSDIIIANNNYEHIKSIWKSDHQELSQLITKWKDQYKRLVIQEEDIKAEAVKEFAERLKNATLPICIGGKYNYEVITKQGIDHILKEKAGEG